MNEIDRFKRPDHHLEVCDLPISVPFDQIGAVDEYVLDLDLELEHRVVVSANLADVPEGGLFEDEERGGEVFLCYLAARLRDMNDGRVEYDVIGEKLIEPVGIARLDDLVPFVDGVLHLVNRESGKERVRSPTVREGYLRQFQVQDSRFQVQSSVTCSSASFIELGTLYLELLEVLHAGA